MAPVSLALTLGRFAVRSRHRRLEGGKVVDAPIKIKPDNARSMGTLFLCLSALWFVLGWSLHGSSWEIFGAVSKVPYVLSIICAYIGATSFDGAIYIYDSKISQKKLGVERFIEFKEIELLHYSSNRQSNALAIRGVDAVIVMSGIGFNRATVLRVRRAILERVPNVKHNPIPSDANYQANPDNA